MPLVAVHAMYMNEHVSIEPQIFGLECDLGLWWLLRVLRGSGGGFSSPSDLQGAELRFGATCAS